MTSPKPRTIKSEFWICHCQNKTFTSVTQIILDTGLLSRQVIGHFGLAILPRIILIGLRCVMLQKSDKFCVTKRATFGHISRKGTT